MEKRKKRTRYARFGVFVLLLSMLVPLPAFAAGSANVVRTFVYENNLYTYVELNEIERPVTQVEAKIGGQSFSASGRLETVRQAGYPITYLLLVDNSNSMPPFREQLLEFCQGLSEASGENTRFVLAAFGEEFQILDEGLTAETLEGPLSEIPLDETETHLHSSIDEALDYFEGLPRNGNELRAVVVLTDGVQYDPLEASPMRSFWSGSAIPTSCFIPSALEAIRRLLTVLDSCPKLPMAPIRCCPSRCCLRRLPKLFRTLEDGSWLPALT